MVSCLIFATVVGQASGLIIGRNAETEAADMEKQGRFADAAAWRLAAARAYRELIIPFEKESVRQFLQADEPRLAAICADRAEVSYPRKVKENLALFEQDLQKAGGETARIKVQRHAVEILAKMATIAVDVPSRLSRIEEEERKENWPVAAGYRELAARVFLLITVPFFEVESDRAPEDETQAHFRGEALKGLKSAHENFVAAKRDYQRATSAAAKNREEAVHNRSEYFSQKVSEMEREANQVSALVDAHGRH